MDHQCLQEKSIERLENAVGKLYKVIEGNGSDGLVTKTALLIQAMENLEKSINKIPTPIKLKTYAFWGGGAMVLLLFAGKLVYEVVK